MGHKPRREISLINPLLFDLTNLLECFAGQLYRLHQEVTPPATLRSYVEVFWWQISLILLIHLYVSRLEVFYEPFGIKQGARQSIAI